MCFIARQPGLNSMDHQNYASLPRATARDHTTRAGTRPGLETWPNNQGRPIRPVVVRRVASNWDLVSGSGIVWADAFNHGTSFGKSALGYYQWNVNLFPQFYLGTISVYMQAGSFGNTVSIALLDASGAGLKSASATASASNTGGVTDTLVLSGVSWTFDGSPGIPVFNAAQFTITGDPQFAQASAAMFYATGFLHTIATKP